MIGQILQVLAIVLVAVVLSAFLAPFETLWWWATRSAAEGHHDEDRARRSLDALPSGTVEASSYLVYVSGVGSLSPDVNPHGEKPLLDSIADELDGIAIVSHVYPYDMENVGLTEGRWSSAWWRLIVRLRRSHLGGLAQVLINLRNTFRVMVSADQRYGPVYSLGIARVIWEELLRAGYRPGARKPIVLLGWSGGAQIALGAVWYLAATKAPVYLISLGGFMNGDPAVNRVRHLWHLEGSRDHVQSLAQVLPGRWPWRRHSRWQQAVAEGRITVEDIGPLKHLGRGSYLSSGVTLADGRTGRQTTIAAIADALVGEGLATRKAGAAPTDATVERPR